MSRLNFTAIVEQTPKDGAVAHLERVMRTAERDYSYKPDDFISDLSKEVERLKKQDRQKFDKAQQNASQQLTRIDKCQFRGYQYVGKEGTTYEDYNKEQSEKYKTYLLEILEAVFEFKFDHVEMALKEITQKKTLSLPNYPKLDTPKAMKIFEKAIEAGLMKKTETEYKWNEQKVLLAYFAEKMSLAFELGKSRYGEQTTNWKLFESIFNVQNLKSAKYDWMKIYTSFSPPGYEKVDNLFE